MKKIFLVKLILFLIVATNAEMAMAQKRQGNPAENLPPYIKRVSAFGERPEWSHDGKKILFVSKPMGEVYEVELETGLVYPKTRHFNHYGFTRARYLSNGDILLAGPIEPFDPTDKEERKYARDHCWLSILPKEGNAKPTPLNIICAEGPAVSLHKPMIGWTERDKQKPELGKNRAQIFVADIEYDNGVPKTVNKKMVFDSKQLDFPLGGASLEIQDIVPPDDDKVIYTVYLINEGNNTDTYMVDIKTGEFQNLTRSPGFYDEPEGVFPNGKFTCVEHGSSKDRAWPLIDIYKLKLDGSGQMQRLTFFTEYEGYKGSQGVVSNDGRYLCFQMGKSGDEAGVGHGFFVMDLEAAKPHLGPFKSYAEEDFVNY